MSRGVVVIKVIVVPGATVFFAGGTTPLYPIDLPIGLTNNSKDVAQVIVRATKYGYTMSVSTKIQRVKKGETDEDVDG